MDKENIITPCISVCRSDPITDFCYGCGRTTEDKRIWNDPNTTNEWKKTNLKITRNRLQGWQQEAWDRSYNHKKDKGISLLKQNILNQKK